MTDQPTRHMTIMQEQLYDLTMNVLMLTERVTRLEDEKSGRKRLGDCIQELWCEDKDCVCEKSLADETKKKAKFTDFDHETSSPEKT